jgi:sortase A
MCGADEQHMNTGDRIRWWARGLGEVLITGGVVVLLFCVFELQVTSIYAEGQQSKLEKALDEQWEPGAPGPIGPAAPTTLGSAFSRLYFPTLGKNEVKVVVEGVGVADLKKGPGHYPGTALPGQLGNLVISGHRTTYGAPFRHLDRMEDGDEIVVETRTSFYTYTVRKVFVVKPTAVQVTYPVPYKQGVAPTERLLTLTTCHPPYSAKERLIVQAVLASSLTKGPGVVPPALDRVALGAR